MDRREFSLGLFAALIGVSTVSLPKVLANPIIKSPSLVKLSKDTTWITTAGLNLLCNAVNNGPPIDINSMIFGSCSLEDTEYFSEESVDNPVAFVSGKDFSFHVLSNDAINFGAKLETGSDSFKIGNMGLFTRNGIMIAKSVAQKHPMNKKIFNMVICLQNIEEKIAGYGF